MTPTTFAILNPGTARELRNGDWIATSTAVLLRDSGRTIVVDPGQDERALLSGLAAAGVAPRDVDLIYLTHHHLDHIVLMRLFPQADVMMCDLLASGDRCIYVNDTIPRTQIRIVHTPGHFIEHYSLLFNNDTHGRVAVAGDVWWWQDEEEQLTDRESLLTHPDPHGQDPDALRQSRELLLKEADYIIPAHGQAFRVG